MIISKFSINDINANINIDSSNNNDNNNNTKSSCLERKTFPRASSAGRRNAPPALQDQLPPTRAARPQPHIYIYIYIYIYHI